MFTLLMVGGVRFIAWWYMALVRWARRMVRAVGKGSLWRDMRELFRLDEGPFYTEDWILLDEKMIPVIGSDREIRMRHWRLERTS